MRLYIVQHGDAVSKDADPDRPLSDRGRTDIQRLTEWLDRHETRIGQILHSGKTRARQTAEILGSLLEQGGTIDEQDGLAPNDAPGDFIEQLKNAEKDILIASHMPFVARTVSQALTGTPDSRPVDFSPGSVAGIERRDDDTWCLVLFVRPDYF